MHGVALAIPNKIFYLATLMIQYQQLIDTKKNKNQKIATCFTYLTFSYFDTSGVLINYKKKSFVINKNC